jgi:hypothetical protein
MPLESPEIQAKRNAPENAFNKINQGYKLLPASPKSAFVPAEDNPQITVEYLPDQDSLGEYLYIRRPDNDSEFIDYLNKCIPSVTKFQEATKQSYFLIPFSWTSDEASDGDLPKQLKYGKSIIRNNNKYLIANAIHQVLSGNETNGFQCYMDSLRLSLLFDADGADDVADMWRNELSAFHLFHKIARKASSDTLQKTIQETLSLRDKIGSGIKNIEFLFRELDSYKDPLSARSVDMKNIRNLLPSRAITSRLKSRIYCYLIKYSQIRLHSFILVHKDEFLGLSQKSFQVAKCSLEKYRNKKNSYFDLSTCFISKLSRIVESRANARLVFDGIVLLCGMELFRRDKGFYPESLDQLTPDYLTQTPLDPFSGEPLKYTRKSIDNYLLYSIGNDGKDNGGRQKATENDIVIHQPRNQES